MMPDREKVIRGWERCRKHTCPSIDSKEYADCEYTVGLYCRQDLLIDDTLELLKEQEAVEPKKADNPEESEYCCGICGYPLWLDEMYCAHCGRHIAWEGR